MSRPAVVCLMGEISKALHCHSGVNADIFTACSQSNLHLDHIEKGLIGVQFSQKPFSHTGTE